MAPSVFLCLVLGASQFFVRQFCRFRLHFCDHFCSAYCCPSRLYLHVMVFSGQPLPFSWWRYCVLEILTSMTESKVANINLEWPPISGSNVMGNALAMRANLTICVGGLSTKTCYAKQNFGVGPTVLSNTRCLCTKTVLSFDITWVRRTSIRGKNVPQWICSCGSSVSATTLALAGLQCSGLLSAERLQGGISWWLSIIVCASCMRTLAVADTSARRFWCSAT